MNQKWLENDKRRGQYLMVFNDQPIGLLLCRMPGNNLKCHDNDTKFIITLNKPLVMSTMKPYDSNQQTALDMASARNRTSINVENVCNFLHRELLPGDSTLTGSRTVNCTRWT